MAEITSEIWDAAGKAVAASMERACNQFKSGLVARMPIAQAIADAERRGEERARAATQFKDGDLVVLKSGGPVMTVDSQGRDDEIVGCRWFRMDGKLESEFFHSECLRHAVEGDQVA